jgi:glutathione S-transferase
MSLRLYHHPLSSFCQKVLIALYENDTAFEPLVVDLMDEQASAAFKRIWPIGEFPVLHDTGKDRVVPESSIIIEHLALHHPGRTALVPADPDLALETRRRDRFFDLHVQVPMQKIVFDRLRPADAKDPMGVEHARTKLETALLMLDADMATRTWATGNDFSMADCAAAPALHYANLVAPFGDRHKSTAAYYARLLERPSFARVMREAEPYRHLFPTA